MSVYMIVTADLHFLSRLQCKHSILKPLNLKTHVMVVAHLSALADWSCILHKLPVFTVQLQNSSILETDHYAIE